MFLVIPDVNCREPLPASGLLSLHANGISNDKFVSCRGRTKIDCGFVAYSGLGKAGAFPVDCREEAEVVARKNQCQDHDVDSTDSPV